MALLLRKKFPADNLFNSTISMCRRVSSRSEAKDMTGCEEMDVWTVTETLKWLGELIGKFMSGP